jgi:drug/metabolite transporter (DMT)-like permease
VEGLIWRNVALIIVCMLVSDWANVFLKLGATRVGFRPTIQGVLDLARNPYLLAGLVLYGAGMLLWITVLARNRFSAVIVIFSIHYLHLMILSRFVFKEQLSWNMWAGAVFVMVGVALYSAGDILVKHP